MIIATLSAFHRRPRDSGRLCRAQPRIVRSRHGHYKSPCDLADRRCRPSPQRPPDGGIVAASALPTIQIPIAARFVAAATLRRGFLLWGLCDACPRTAASLRAPARKGRHHTTLNRSCRSPARQESAKSGHTARARAHAPAVTQGSFRASVRQAIMKLSCHRGLSQRRASPRRHARLAGDRYDRTRSDAVAGDPLARFALKPSHCRGAVQRPSSRAYPDLAFQLGAARAVRLSSGRCRSITVENAAPSGATRTSAIALRLDNPTRKI